MDALMNTIVVYLYLSAAMLLIAAGVYHIQHDRIKTMWSLATSGIFTMASGLFTSWLSQDGRTLVVLMGSLLVLSSFSFRKSV